MNDESDGSDGDAFDWGAEVFDLVEEQVDEPEVLRFDVGGQAFAFVAASVAEVTAPFAVTRLPGLPGYIPGVAVHRRNVMGVLDLAQFLELEGEASDPSRFVVIEAGDLEAAVAVDEVTGLELWPEDAESATLLENVAARIREFAVSARWAPGGVVILLDAARVLELASVR